MRSFLTSTPVSTDGRLTLVDARVRALSPGEHVQVGYDGRVFEEAVVREVRETVSVVELVKR